MDEYVSERKIYYQIDTAMDEFVEYYFILKDDE